MISGDADPKTQAEAALLQASAVLKECGVDFILYVRTSDHTYARHMSYHTGKHMIEGAWFVQVDLGRFTKDVAMIAADEVDKAGGPNGD
jgi:hypothetical protein